MKSTKGLLKWSYTVPENETEGEVIITIEVSGTCEYTFYPGCPATGPTYSCGGTPAEPPYAEYYNFKGKTVEVTIWTQPEGKERVVLFHQTEEYATREDQDAAGEWYERVVNSTNELESLDELVSKQLEPCDRDDEED